MMREGKEWGEIVEIYRKNKRNKSTDIIEEGQIYQKNRRKEKTVEEEKSQEKLEGDRCQKRRKYRKKKQNN